MEPLPPWREYPFPGVGWRPWSHRFNIITHCWLTDPKRRPQFLDLADALTAFLMPDDWVSSSIFQDVRLWSWLIPIEWIVNNEKMLTNCQCLVLTAHVELQNRMRTRYILLSSNIYLHRKGFLYMFTIAITILNVTSLYSLLHVLLCNSLILYYHFQ